MTPTNSNGWKLVKKGNRTALTTLVISQLLAGIGMSLGWMGRRGFGGACLLSAGLFITMTIVICITTMRLTNTLKEPE